MSAMTSSGDPFAQGLAQLEHALPLPSTGYKARVIALFTLCALLVVSSILFIILHLLHARRIGKSMWFLRLQRGESGRLVVVNSLPVFAMLAALAAGGQMASAWQDWNTFVKGNMPYNAAIARFMPWLVVLVQALFFSTTNLHATVAARKRFGAASSVFMHAWVQNAVLLGVPCVIVGVLIPIVILLNQKQNELIRASQALIPLLMGASQSLTSGAGVDIQTIEKLTEIRARILTLESQESAWVKALCAVSFLFVGTIIIMNAYSLLLVYTLRKHVKANRNRTMQARAISFLQDKEVTVDQSNQDGPSKSTWQITGTQLHSMNDGAGPFLAPSQPSQGPTKASLAAVPAHQSDIALQRLTSDLSFSVPIVLIMSIVWIIGLALITNNRFSRSWALYELTVDGFGWVYLVATTCAIWFFTFNLCRAWKSDRAMSDGTNTIQDNRLSSTQQFDVTLNPRMEVNPIKEKDSESSSVC